MLAVFIDQIDDLVIDAQVFGNGPGVFDVLLGRAVGQGHFLVHPGPDVGAGHIVALLFKQKGCNGAINAAGKRYENFLHAFKERSESCASTGQSRNVVSNFFCCQSA